MWAVSPLFLFSSDNTLDPARLSLLPLRARELLPGMAAAAWIGVPPIATLIAVSGSVVGLGRSPAGVAAAIVGALLAAVLCVFTSRALASALAGALRSRRGRDLGTGLLVVLVGSGGILCTAIPAALAAPGVYDVVTGVCRWLPPGLAASAGADASDGRWGALAVDLLIPAAALAAVVLWWGRTLAAALVTPISGGPGRRPGAAPSALYPRLIARWIPQTRAGAVYARELRYMWRSPYRRSTLALAVVGGTFFGFSSSAFTGGASSVGPFTGCYTAAIFALGMGNALGYEGRSLWLHHVVPGPVWPDWAGRIVAAVSVGMIPATVASVAGAAISGGWALLPVAIALAVVVLAALCAVAAILGTVFPYPMANVDANPFSSSMGGGLRAMASMLVLMIGSLALISPVLALVIAGASGWTPGLALGVIAGLGYAPALVAGGAWAAGAIQDRRGPEILAVVAPRT
jgi:ABC-2 type transport system permease protein